MSKCLLFLFVFCLCVKGFSQRLGPEGDAGVQGFLFLKNGERAYAAHLELRVSARGDAWIGVGIAPMFLQKAKESGFVVYGDLRTPVCKNLYLTLQPGYNFFSQPLLEYVINPFWMYEAKTEGGFYGGAGFTYHLPSKKSLKLFLQVKYNYFRFEVTEKTYSTPTVFETAKRQTASSGLSLGGGVRF